MSRVHVKHKRIDSPLGEVRWPVPSRTLQGAQHPCGGGLILVALRSYQLPGSLAPD